MNELNEISQAIGALQSEASGLRQDIRDLAERVRQHQEREEPRLRDLEQWQADREAHLNLARGAWRGAGRGVWHVLSALAGAAAAWALAHFGRAK